jgi:hypothetical protein
MPAVLQWASWPVAFPTRKELDFDHAGTGPHAAVKRRRSQRIFVDVPLIVCGEQQESFREQAFTLTVNAHGALVLLASSVEVGQQVLLMNPKSRDEREGRVRYLGRVHAGVGRVGIEFREPAPEFWSLSSPPPDWNPSGRRTHP